MTGENMSLTRAERKKATRRKLMDETIEIIAVEGLSGVTLPKVARNAGLSRGICNFHFSTKEQLLLETFEDIYNEHQAAWRSALADEASSPVERMHQFIRVLLLPPVADIKKAAVWMAYWGEARSRQTYLDLCSARDREFEDAAAAILTEISGGSFEKYGLNPRSIAVALTGMIDGFWVQFLIAPERLSPREGILACLAYLSTFFPQFKKRLETEACQTGEGSG